MHALGAGERIGERERVDQREVRALPELRARRVRRVAQIDDALRVPGREHHVPVLGEEHVRGVVDLRQQGARRGLERLELSGCRRLGPGSVEALAQLQTLRELDLVGAGLGGESLTRLRDALPACAIRSLE